MNWLKNKIRNWLSEDDIEANYKINITSSTGNNQKYARNTIGSLAVEKSDKLDSEPIRLKIFRATGGLIIETQTYNNINDQRTTKLHIVSNDGDMGDSISKILTLESLRG